MNLRTILGSTTEGDTFAISRIALSKLVVVGSVAVSIAIGVFAQRQLVDQRDESQGLILWAVAICIFLIGLVQATYLAKDERNGIAGAATADSFAAPVAPVMPWTAAIPWLNEALLFSGVVGVGVLFRFYRLGDIPPGLNHDAAWNGLHALRTTPVVDFFTHPYVPEAWGRETLFHQIIATYQWIVGPTQLAIQLAGVTVGILTLGVFYFFARRLFDTRFAMIATFLLSVSGWHMTMSKTGWRMILVPLFAALVFYFLLKAVQERKMRDFFLAGIALGLSLNSYDAGRIIPIVAGVYLLYEIVRDPSLLLRQYRHLALVVVGFVIAFAPLGWYALNNWHDFTGRGNFLWIGNQIDEAGSWEPLWTNIKNALLMFNFSANGDDFFVREPLLDLPVSVFFTLGLVYGITRIRHRQYFLLMIMIVLMLLVGIASKPNGNRGIGTIIPTTALAAIFLYESWRWLEASYPRYRELLSIGLVGVLLYTGYTTFDSYLGPDRRDQWGFYPETTRVGRYMHDLPGEYQIFAAAGNWPRDALTYISYQGEGDPFQPRYEYTNNASDLLGKPPAENVGTAFIIEAGNDDVVAALQERFPAATMEEIYYPDDTQNVIAYVLLVPPGGGEGAQTDAVFVATGGEERDDQRREALATIGAALTEYGERTGRFPDTADNVQTACVYVDLDALCVLQDELGLDIFIDPLGDPGRYGYWYSSNGLTFTIYSAFEGEVTAGETCTPTDAALAQRANLYCLRGP
ncbi:MAG: glycosyltransferase family 39 protein [Dehalococcoidia bacterium]